MANYFKLTVEKSGKRSEIDELDDRFFIGGEPDRSRAFDDKETVVELTKE